MCVQIERNPQKGPEERYVCDQNILAQGCRSKVITTKGTSTHPESCVCTIMNIKEIPQEISEKCSRNKIVTPQAIFPGK